MSCPSELKARLSIAPDSLLIAGEVGSQVATSHRRTSFRRAAARRRPSGLNAMAVVAPDRSRDRCSRDLTGTPLAVFQTRTKLSAPAAASSCPSGLKARAVIGTPLRMVPVTGAPRDSPHPH